MKRYVVIVPKGEIEQQFVATTFPDNYELLPGNVWIVGGQQATCADVCEALGIGRGGKRGVVPGVVSGVGSGVGPDVVLLDMILDVVPGVVSDVVSGESSDVRPGKVSGERSGVPEPVV